MNDRLTIGGKQYCIQKGLLRILTLYDEFIDEVADPESTVKEIRERSLPVDLLSFLQLPPETSPKFSYHMQWDNLAVLEISTYENWLNRQIHQNTRKKIRKAERDGVIVQVEAFSDKLASGLVELFNETPMRRGKRYPYFGWGVEMVRREWATQLDRSLWLVAYYKEEVIGFIKLIVGHQLARASGTLAKLAHRDKAPMNALLAKAVEVCASRGVPLLVYGKFTYGRKGEDSLTAFKKRSGFQRLNVPRYYVPLSIWGRITLRLSLHRSLSEVVPAPALRLLLKLRSKWHETVPKA